MKFVAIVAMLMSFSSFASECMRTRDYDVYTANTKICDLIKKDACARAVVKAVKERVMNEQAMDDGVDLPESIEVNSLQKTGTDTYSITAEESIVRLAQVKKNASSCAVKSLYN